VKKLLLFLAENCEFLFRPDYYRIVDSGSSHSMGNAHVDLRWREIVLQFTLDRSAIDLGIHLPEKKWTVDVGILRAYLGKGDLGDQPVMDATWAGYLEEVLPEFEHLWADEDGRGAFVKECQRLKTKRSKIWFG